MEEVLYHFLFVVLLGAFGGLLHYLMEYYRRKLEDFELKRFIFEIFMGACASILWYMFGLPDTVNYFLAGYFSISVIQNLTRDFGKRQEENERERRYGNNL